MSKFENLKKGLEGWPTNWKASIVNHDLESVDPSSGDEFMWLGDWEGLGRDSDVIQFGPGDDCGPQLGQFVADVVNAAPALLALWQACEAERAAVCETESTETDDYTIANFMGECAGDTHDDACPVAIARAAVTAVLERGLS